MSLKLESFWSSCWSFMVLIFILQSNRLIYYYYVCDYYSVWCNSNDLMLRLPNVRDKVSWNVQRQLLLRITY